MPPTPTAAGVAPLALSRLSPHLQAALLDRAEPLYLAEPDGRIAYANAGFRALAPQLGGGGTALVAPDQVRAADGDGRAPLVSAHTLIRDGVARTYVGEHHAVLRDNGALEAVIARFVPRDSDSGALAAERLDDLSRLVSDWLWEVDSELRFVFLSPRVNDALGVHPLELLGRGWDWLLGAAAADFQEILRTAPTPFRDREVAVVHRNGERRLFHLSGVPVFDRADGRFKGYRGAARDITEMRAREQALIHAKLAAEEASRTKTGFLAQMSHELRTPLNAIIGFSEIIEQETLGPIGNANYREYAGDIGASARHLLQVINDVLDVAKIESGRFELHHALIDLDEVARQVLRTMRPRAEAAGLALHYRKPDAPLGVRADEVKLRQVLLNLLANAVKFTDSGGEVELRVAIGADGDAVLSVRDTGIGMNEKDIEVALTPFAQVDSGLSRRSEGTGLGLPLSRALVELHGGRLDIDSAPGEGTVVTATLPASRVAG